MGCELIFNELSLSAPAKNVEEAQKRIKDLLKLVQAASRMTGGRQLRVSRDFFAFEVAPGYPIRKWLNDGAVDREARRKLKSSVTALSYIDKTKDPPEILQKWKSAECHAGVERAQGLFAAFLLDSLAISIPSKPCWLETKIGLRITWREGAPWPEESAVVVARNVARITDLETHSTWLQQRDGISAVFRQRIDPAQCRHVPASRYGKHVCGGSNDERRRAARNSGNGQFFAFFEQRRVTDETIRDWEAQALLDGWRGSIKVQIVQRSEAGDMFHLYCEKEHLVGYAGASGEETPFLRVEVASRQVHSHPRLRSSARPIRASAAKKLEHLERLAAGDEGGEGGAEAQELL